MDVVLLFPGQGSQKPGMGKDLHQAFPESRAVFDQADDTLGRPLSTMCFEGPAEDLMVTRNAQPALLTHSAAALAAIGGGLSSHVRAAAGHSLGEISAYHAARSIGVRDAVRLVQRRGELMHAAGIARPGAMAAILGHPTVSVSEICERASRQLGKTVVVANYNHAEQIVISGDVGAVECANVLAREAGAKRAMMLQVSGAFHSPLMAPATEAFRAAVSRIAFGGPAFPVYATVTAAPVCDVAIAADLLVQQLTSPVRWIEVVQRLAGDYPDALFLEVGPGAVLSGLVKKIAPGLRTACCGTVEDVDRIRLEYS